MLSENKGLMLLKVRTFVFENNTLNEDMLNIKQIENNLKWLIFWSNFFNLMTRWLGDKLERVYLAFIESTQSLLKKKNLLKSQLT